VWCKIKCCRSYCVPLKRGNPIKSWKFTWFSGIFLDRKKSGTFFKFWHLFKHILMNIREFFYLILSKNDGMISVWRSQVGARKKTAWPLASAVSFWKEKNKTILIVYTCSLSMNLNRILKNWKLQYFYAFKIKIHFLCYFFCFFCNK